MSHLEARAGWDRPAGGGTNDIDAGAMTTYDMNRPAALPRAFPHATFAHTAGTLVLATVATAFPVAAHFSGHAIGLAACVVLGMLIANFATAIVPPVLIFSYLFQNLFVALVSPHLGSLDDFNAIRAYNFVLTAAAWTVVAAHYFTSRQSFDRRLRRLMDVSFLALGIVAVYFAIGLASNPKGAAVYLRNIATPFMLFHCFALIGFRFRIAVQGAFVVMAWALVAYGYGEALMQERLFELTNGGTYVELSSRVNDPAAWLKELQQYGRVLRSYFDTLAVDFLNTPLLGDLRITVHRLLGPNFHAISYAYALAFFALVLAASGNVLYLLAAAPLLVLIGSKGAIVLVIAAIAGLIVSRFIRWRGLFWLYVAALLAWAAAGIVIGLRAGDYHVIGFLGGLENFAHHPLGQGLGSGGNLRLDTTQIDWSRSQQLGQTDVAVESAVGVMLSQMGFGAIAILLAALWIVWRVWTLYMHTGDRLTGIAALGLFAILVNGIFQEEALFAPLAFGTMMALAGLLLGRSCRAETAAEPRSALGGADLRQAARS